MFMFYVVAIGKREDQSDSDVMGHVNTYGGICSFEGGFDVVIAA